MLFSVRTFNDILCYSCQKSLQQFFKYDESYVTSFLHSSDETIPCDGINLIEDHCKSVLGDDVFARHLTEPKGYGKNAIEGCIRYVGYHVFTADHIACCVSDTCEDWLGEYIRNVNDDDFDDDDVDEFDDDDGETHGDEF